MQTHARLFLIRAARIVRMFEIKSSMKGIVRWYFSWPACPVRSGRPWPFELGLSASAAVWILWLCHNISWSHHIRDETFTEVGHSWKSLSLFFFLLLRWWGVSFNYHLIWVFPGQRHTFRSSVSDFSACSGVVGYRDQLNTPRLTFPSVFA